MTPLPIIVPDHFRFACHGCGACCRTWRVTVEADEVARISAHDWSAEGERFAGGVFVEAERCDSDAWGTPRGRRELRKIGGACIFLDAANRCLVHARLGAGAKPDLCRLFPLAGVRLPDGAIEVSVVPECESWHLSFASGPRLAADGAGEVPAPFPARLAVPAPPALSLRAGGPLLLWDAARRLAGDLGCAIGNAPDLAAAFAAWPAILRAAEAQSGRRVSARRAAEPADRAAPPDFATAMPRVLRALDGSFENENENDVSAVLGAATRKLAAGEVWRGALAGLPADARPFAAAVVRAWVEGPLLAQARCEIEALLGLVIACAHLLPAAAAIVAEAAGRAAPLPADASRAAKMLSLFLRDARVAALVRSAAADLRALAVAGGEPAAPPRAP